MRSGRDLVLNDAVSGEEGELEHCSILVGGGATECSNLMLVSTT